jgi:aminoglycoside phosphotransferase
MVAALPVPKDAPLVEATRARPARDEFETIQPLKGHSGAEVVLCLRGQTSVVRKTSGSVAQNRRLQDQMAKQRLLTAHGLPFPRVLAEGIDPIGRAYAEMEYVPARTVASVIAAAAPFDQSQLLKAVERALTLFRMTASNTLDPEIFRGKIGDIIANADAVASAPLANEIVRAGNELLGRDWSAIPASSCHGDLTLENILLHQRRTVFIDCDETFASSYWLDLSKLFQDVDGHWCLRHLYLDAPTGTALVNAIGRLHRLAAPLRALAGAIAPNFAAYKPQLTALNLFRTIPYTSDTRQIAFVLSRMRFLLSTAEA